MAKNKLKIFYENHNFHTFCSTPKEFYYFLINDLNLTSRYSSQFTLIFQAFFSPMWVMKSTTWESNKFWIMKKALHMQTWFNHSLFFMEKQDIGSPSLQTFRLEFWKMKRLERKKRGSKLKNEPHLQTNDIIGPKQFKIQCMVNLGCTSR